LDRRWTQMKYICMECAATIYSDDKNDHEVIK